MSRKKDETKSEAILNLDEFMGESKPIYVAIKGSRYQLKHPDQFGPVEFTRLSKIQERVDSLRQVAAEINDNEAAELNKLVIDMVTALCPELAEMGLSFVVKLRILDFYRQEVGGDSGEDPKAAKPAEATPASAGTPSSPSSPTGTD